MEIRQVKYDELLKIESLFQSVYGRSQGVYYWRWCFDTLYGYLPMGMFDGDKLVSYMAAVLLEKGAILYSSMTDPEYRGMGYFWKTSTRLYEELSKYRDWCCFYSSNL